APVAGPGIPCGPCGPCGPVEPALFSFARTDLLNFLALTVPFFSVAPSMNLAAVAVPVLAITIPDKKAIAGTHTRRRRHRGVGFSIVILQVSRRANARGRFRESFAVGAARALPYLTTARRGARTASSVSRWSMVDGRR